MPRAKRYFEGQIDVGYAQSSFVVNVSGLDDVSVKLAVASGASSTTATFNIETSMDKVTWDTAGYVSSSDGTFTTAPCSGVSVPAVKRQIPVSDVPWLRVVLATTHTAGIFVRVQIYGEGEYGGVSGQTVVSPGVNVPAVPGSPFTGPTGDFDTGSGAPPGAEYTGEISSKE